MKFRSEFDDGDFFERNETGACWKLLVWTRGSVVSVCAPKARLHRTTSHERDTQYVSTSIMWRARVCTCACPAHAPRNARYARAPLHGTHMHHCTSHAPKFVFNAVRRWSHCQCCATGSAVSCCAHTFVRCLLWTVCVACLFCCLLVGSAAFFTQCFSRMIIIFTVFFLTPLTGLTQTEGLPEMHRATTLISDYFFLEFGKVRRCVSFQLDAHRQRSDIAQQR